jgi:hypothetical protein
MFDPTTLPIAMADRPSIAALRLTSNSGADVPKETTVKPITNVDTLNFNAIPTAPFTRNSPPITSVARPIIKIRTEEIISFLPLN